MTETQRTAEALPTLSQSGPVWTIDLGDGENRFSLEWIERLEGLLSNVALAEAPVALVTTGSAKFYSNGLDLDWLGANLDQFDTYVHRVQGLLAQMLALPVPTVAVVNGHAFGAGAMLATAHDYRVMRADRGYFCFPEVDIKIPFSAGMSSLIMSKFSPQAALAAMTTGRRYAGPEAEAAHLVDAVGAVDELPSLAAGLVTDLAGKDRATLGQIKATMFADVLAALRNVE